MAKAEKERIYECEARRQFVDSTTKAREWRWTVKSVVDVVGDHNAEVRCKDCHGRVRLHRKHVEHGPAPHVEHLLHQDSEYCQAGMHFKRATDGRAHQLSNDPVR